MQGPGAAGKWHRGGTGGSPHPATPPIADPGRSHPVHPTPCPMRQHLLIITFLCVVTGVPFLQQAYTVDGPTFVAVAKHLQRHPTRIVEFQYDHLGERVDHYILEMTHPPVWPYMLAGVYEIAAGETEKVSHLLTLLMAIAAGVGVYLLARRIGVPCLTAGVVLVTTPVFLVMSHTVMAETASLAFVLLGTWLFLVYRDRPRWGPGLLAGAALIFAAGVAYQSAVILPALAISSPRRRWGPLLAPVIAIAAWMVVPWVAGVDSPLTSGIAPYVGKVAENPWQWIPQKAACLMAYFGLCPFFVIAAIRSIRTVTGAAVGVALLLIGAAIYWRLEIAPGIPGTIFFGILFAAGAGAVLQATREGLREGETGPDPDSRFLLGWIGVGLVFAIFVLNFAAVRHTLILLPPIVLLLLRRPVGAAASRVSIGASLALGLLLSVADARFAEAFRSLPEGAAEALAQGGDHWGPPGRDRDTSMRFNAEWGFRHYREAEGQRYFLPDVRPLDPGQRLLTTTQTASVALPPEVASRLTLVKTIPMQDRYPIRMMHHGARAGFYCHGWGMLPFTLSTRPIEILQIHEANWFLWSLDTARIRREEGTEAAAPAAGLVGVGGDYRYSLFLHPPGEVGYECYLPRRPLRLRFSMGIPEAAWEKGGDGVEFEVWITQSDTSSDGGTGVWPPPERAKLYSRHLDPRRRPADRGWQTAQVDLGPWVGWKVEIAFVTRGGPAGDISFDWAFWADPRIIPGKRD